MKINLSFTLQNFFLVIIGFQCIFDKLILITAQKCVAFDLNLKPIIYDGGYNSVNSICKNIYNNDNLYCETTISNCACKKNFYGENCQNKIENINVINKGISSGEFTILIVILIIIFPAILIIGLVLIFFICRNNPNNTKINKTNYSINKKAKINNLNINSQNEPNFNDIEKKINSVNNISSKIGSNQNNFNYIKTENTNILSKQELETVNNITDNNFTNNDNKYKYSQIPLSTERRDDNMLITIRNNTEIDNDTSAYKRPGIQDLNKEENKIKMKLDQIEVFISEFKSSLQENFTENEDFMLYIDKVFSIVENHMNQRVSKVKDREKIKKIQKEIQKVFLNLNEEIPNGKNYIKANNFFSRYEELFNNNDELNKENIIEEDEENFNKNLIKLNDKSNFDLSFSYNAKGEISDISDYNNKINRKENLSNNKDNFEIPGSRNNLQSESSYLGVDNSSNEILKSKNKILKKAFAIKSVQITKSNFRGKKGEEKNVELSDTNKNSHQRNESKQSAKYQSYHNASKNDK